MLGRSVCPFDVERIIWKIWRDVIRLFSNIWGIILNGKKSAIKKM